MNPLSRNPELRWGRRSPTRPSLRSQLGLLASALVLLLVPLPALADAARRRTSPSIP